MIQGFNHNIKYKEIIFHIQTEDLGEKISKIITHVFIEGNIIKTIKNSYTLDNEKKLRLMMKEQHKLAISGLISGQYDDAIKLFQNNSKNKEKIKEEELAFLDNSYVISKQLNFIHKVSNKMKNNNKSSNSYISENSKNKKEFLDDFYKKDEEIKINEKEDIEFLDNLDKHFKQINKISKKDIDNITKSQQISKRLKKKIENKLPEEEIKKIRNSLLQIPIFENEMELEQNLENKKDISNLDQMIIDFLEKS